MKTRRSALAAASASAFVLVGALLAVAQQAATQNNQSNQNDQAQQADQNQQGNRFNQADQNRRAADRERSAKSRASSSSASKDLSKLDDNTSGSTVRASTLIGLNLKNSNGDSVGEIKDLLIDQSGKVRYAAVTYGGFLGVGSKMFAVPFEAFKVQRNPNDPNDADDYVLTLDVSKDQLDGSEGFDNDHWPNFADQKFTQDLARRYKVNRNQAHDRDGVDVNVRTGQTPNQQGEQR